MGSVSVLASDDGLSQQTESDRNQVSTIECRATEVVIESRDDLVTATSLLSDISKLRKSVEDKRKSLVQPLNDGVKRVNNFFKAIVEPLERAERQIRDRMSAYRASEQAKIVVQDTIPEAVGMVAEKTIRTQGAAKVTFRTDWKWEIVDESMIPREYLAPDSMKLNTVVRAGLREIPGIRVYSVETPVVT